MKTAKKALSVLLAVLVLFSTVALSASAKTAGDVAVGESFLFGMYPQSRVTDAALLKTLNNATPDANGDVAIGANVYRHGYMKEFGPGFNSNFMRYFGYELKTDYWFKYEPIKWRVLANEADGVLMMAEPVLDARTFNDDISKGNDWVNSDVRAWLNGAFLTTAFTATEQEALLETVNENKGNFVCKTAGSADTVDRVFLPSFEEITNKAYGFNLDWTAYDDFGNFAGYYDLDPARKAKRTDYSEFKGVWIDDSEPEPFGDEIEYEGETVYGRYWLRTEGRENDVNFVLCDGRVSMGWPADYPIFGIRPLIRVTPDALQNPIRLAASDGAVRYRQKGVKVDSNMEVIFTSSDPSIAEIDSEGNVIINDVGTVTITAYLPGDETTFTTCQLEISYTWWQQAIRIFLFGWIWY